MSNEKVAGWSAYPTPIKYKEIEWIIQNLSGKILTIVDASISDKQQNKALKDLIKKDIRETLDRFQHIASNGEAGHEVKL